MLARVSECASVGARVSECASEWTCERVGEWVREQVSEWASVRANECIISFTLNFFIFLKFLNIRFGSLFILVMNLSLDFMFILVADSMQRGHYAFNDFRAITKDMPVRQLLKMVLVCRVVLCMFAIPTKSTSYDPDELIASHIFK